MNSFFLLNLIEWDKIDDYEDGDSSSDDDNGNDNSNYNNGSSAGCGGAGVIDNNNEVCDAD